MKEKLLTVLIYLFFFIGLVAHAKDITLSINKRFLNLPVSHQTDRKIMSFIIDGKKERDFRFRLASGEPDYWIFCDMQSYIGKKITISYDGDGLQQIYLDDKFAGQDSVYKEKNRPLLHYTQRRGWCNDPNGLVWYDGEYHLFYQHNPYEKEWENMHWGHAVSNDLLHWEELNEAIYPDQNGAAFSGSAVIDYNNTSGFGTKENPAMIAIYTGAGEKQVQCLAYSLDKGRTWIKYKNNPIIDSGSKWNTVDTRDPKVFWYNPNKEWVMVLNERDGHSIYTSRNLKNWTYESHVTGFWECPELFELPVDGDSNNKKWVMYGASGTYMIGSFDGRKFIPEAGKYYFSGGNIYAAQTFNNIPITDGRRIQIGWGRVNHFGLPINGCQTLPSELSLRTTKDGIRLFCNPIKELKKLEFSGFEAYNLTIEQANELLKEYSDNDVLRLRFVISLSHSTSAGLSYKGQNLLDYDMNGNRVNGTFYSPENMTSMELSVDMIVDRSIAEVFVDNGAYVHYVERRTNNDDGYMFWGNNIEIKSLKVNPMKSIWE